MSLSKDVVSRMVSIMTASLDEPIKPVLDITVQTIGTLDADTGTDQYVLLTRKDRVLDTRQAEEWLLEKVYRESKGPGQPYTHRITGLRADDMRSVICIIHNRRDV